MTFSKCTVLSAIVQLRYPSAWYKRMKGKTLVWFGNNRQVLHYTNIICQSPTIVHYLVVAITYSLALPWLPRVRNCDVSTFPGEWPGCHTNNSECIEVYHGSAVRELFQSQFITSVLMKINNNDHQKTVYLLLTWAKKNCPGPRDRRFWYYLCILHPGLQPDIYQINLNSGSKL